MSAPSVAAALAERLGPRRDEQRFRFSSVGWLVPSLVLIGVLFLFPVAYAVYLGFTNLQLLGPHAQSYWFTGFDNIDRMIHDTVFWRSVRLTLIFVVLSGIVAQTLLGMMLALTMRAAWAPLRLGVGALVILAWVLPEISVAFIWYAFAQADGTLTLLTRDSSANYLASNALLIVCIANAWRGTAFSMLVFTAGLRGVSAEVDEAAQLEGAAYWRRLFSVVLPIMRPTIMTNLLLITLGTLSDFTLIFAMTQGGPGNDTSILPVYMYIEAFQFNELGYGTAIALALILLAALFSALYVRQLRGELSRPRA
ncbi:MAG: sugar ABC transporter permease [Actinomycetota bacterium]|nr:sugar ABC transporter permease [Actinomycetota bacterium]